MFQNIKLIRYSRFLVGETKLKFQILHLIRYSWFLVGKLVIVFLMTTNFPSRNQLYRINVVHKIDSIQLISRRDFDIIYLYIYSRIIFIYYSHFRFEPYASVYVDTVAKIYCERSCAIRGNLSSSTPTDYSSCYSGINCDHYWFVGLKARTPHWYGRSLSYCASTYD